MDTQYLSGIFYKKPDLVSKLIEYIQKDKLTSKIISVGSGTGYLESQIQKSLINKIICVDPEPLSYSKCHPTSILMPNYADLSEIDDSVVNDSIILLSWPNPEYGADDLQNYDCDAIKNYKPRIFIVSYGPCGASGSDKLIELLAGIDNSNNSSSIRIKLFDEPPECRSILNIDNVKYNLIFCHNLTQGSGRGFNGTTYRLIFYVRDDYIKNYDMSEYPVITQDHISHTGECIVS